MEFNLVHESPVDRVYSASINQQYICWCGWVLSVNDSNDSIAISGYSGLSKGFPDIQTWMQYWSFLRDNIKHYHPKVNLLKFGPVSGKDKLLSMSKVFEDISWKDKTAYIRI